MAVLSKIHLPDNWTLPQNGCPGQGRSNCLIFSFFTLPYHDRAESIYAHLSLLNDKPFHLPLITPLGEHVVELHRAIRVLSEEPLSFIFSFTIVVPRRANILVRGHEGWRCDQFYPLVLSFCSRFHALRRALVHLSDDIRDVGGLPVQHVGEVRCQASLREANMEEVREPVAQETMIGSHPLCPVIGESHSALA